MRTRACPLTPTTISTLHERHRALPPLPSVTSSPDKRAGEFGEDLSSDEHYSEDADLLFEQATRLLQRPAHSPS